MNEHEHVARVICRSAVNPTLGLCRFCNDQQQPDGQVVMGDCHMWPTFALEAAAAVEAVRDFNMLTSRRKPRLRRPIDIVIALKEDLA